MARRSGDIEGSEVSPNKTTGDSGGASLILMLNILWFLENFTPQRPGLFECRSLMSGLGSILLNDDYTHRPQTSGIEPRTFHLGVKHP